MMRPSCARLGMASTVGNFTYKVTKVLKVRSEAGNIVKDSKARFSDDTEKQDSDGRSLYSWH